MRPRRRSAATLVATGAAALLPAPVAAHAIGGTFQLPVPLWLYLAGAATAVAASFVVVSVFSRPVTAAGPGEQAPIPRPIASLAVPILRVVGLAAWYGAIVVGVVIGDISPLPAVVLWVLIWIGVPIIAAAIGNPWPAMSPFRTSFAGLEWLAARGGLRLRSMATYPPGLARWPAVALLAAAIWCELVLSGGDRAATVAALMGLYTMVALLGMLVFGREAWARNGELFEVLFGWYGRIGPLAGGRLRGWFVGLIRADGLAWSDAAFVVLLIAGVTYDGLRETTAGATLLSVLLPPILEAFGPTLMTFLLVETAGFAALYAAFLLAFVAVMLLVRAAAGRRNEKGLGAMAGAYAATLMPIAAGYVIAHYATLLIQALVWMPTLVTDPLMSLAPDIGWIPIGFVWYLSVGAIVGGHVAGVALAHRLTLTHAPTRPVPAGVPMVALMIGYTVLSLWIIAQPIVIEPDVVPLEARAPTTATVLSD